MAPFNGVPSQRQQVALALAPKFTASLSICGSSYIIYDCWIRDILRNDEGQKGKKTTYHRLLVGLSVCDLLMSIGLFTSTWPMPSDTPNVWGASGTVQSCEAIGFLEQMGLAAVMYNASLSVYYLLRIRFGWTPSQTEKVELPLHLVPVIFGLATAIASVKLDLFNSGIFDCWIAPFPQGCDESWRNGGTTTCERGDNASLYQWVFDLILKWSAILLVTINMFIIHRGVLIRERAVRRYSIIGRRPSLARQLALQSYLYVGALYITYIPVIITRLTELISGYVYYGMLLTISITIPLQGFWNVYLRPRYLTARQNQRQNGQAHPQGAFNSFLRAVSEAVREGGAQQEDEDVYDNSSEVAQEEVREEGRDVSLPEAASEIKLFSTT